MSKHIFNIKYCQDLREVVNRTNIFYKDKIQSKKFDFICAFMDRFDFAVNYLNEHNKKPKTEIEFMTYLTQASIVRDGIKLCYNLLGLEKDKTNIFFKKYCLKDLNCEPESDDKYYEYLRSLAFAHPLNTDRSIPNKIKGEKQFSPYCLLDLHSFNEDKDSVGIVVYSNKRSSFLVTVPFEVLNNYLKYKYELLKNIINKFNLIIKEMEDNWQKRKVNRAKSDLDILKEVSEILEERYLEHYNIDDLIEYLETDLSEEKNRINVDIFRNKIKELIPLICDAVDEYRTDDLYEICNSVLYLRPKAHPMMDYQLEKIYCYLNFDGKYDNGRIESKINNCEYSNVEWGLIQTDFFSKEFAKKWVIIKPYEMNFKEIRLLVTVACYFEYKEQNGSGKSFMEN